MCAFGFLLCACSDVVARISSCVQCTKGHVYSRIARFATVPHAYIVRVVDKFSQRHNQCFSEVKVGVFVCFTFSMRMPVLAIQLMLVTRASGDELQKREHVDIAACFEHTHVEWRISEIVAAARD